MDLLRRHLLDARYDAYQLAVFRILIGATAAIRALTIIPPLTQHARHGPPDDSVWIEAILRIEGFEGLPFPMWFALGAALLFVVAPLAILTGRGARPAAGALGLLLFYLTHVGAIYRFNGSWTLATMLCLLALSECDRTLVWRRPAAGYPLVPAWPVRLVQLQVVIIYAFAVITKLNESYLSGFVISYHLEYSVFRWLIPDALLESVAVMVSVSLAALLAEGFIAVALCTRRYRAAAFAVATVLHVAFLTLAMTAVQFGRLAQFTLCMFAGLSTFAFLERECWVVRVDPDRAQDLRLATQIRALDWWRSLTFAYGTGPLEVSGPDGQVHLGAPAASRAIGATPVGLGIGPILRATLAIRPEEARGPASTID